MANKTFLPIEPFPLTEEQKAMARRTVCQYALNSVDAQELMMMIGIHPDQIDDGYLTGPPGMNQRSCRQQ